MVFTVHDEDWSQRVRDALARYEEPLLRQVAGRLFKARIGQQPDELIDKAAETQTNPPVIDRRVRDLPDSARVLIGLMGVSQQPEWTVGQLIPLLATAGFAEGFTPIQALLDAGLIFPNEGRLTSSVAAFDSWLGASGTLAAGVFAHPAVLRRSRAACNGAFERLESEQPDADQPPPLDPSAPASTHADGHEWPIRIATVWQQVRETPIRMTQGNSLFKRDLVRLQSDPVLSAPLPEVQGTLPDAGVLTLYWSLAAGWLEREQLEVKAAPFRTEEFGTTDAFTVRLYAALFKIEAWDPLEGYGSTEGQSWPAMTAGLILMARLASQTSEQWISAHEQTTWLWDLHPSWAASLSKEAQKNHGVEWIETFHLALSVPLGLVEGARQRDHWYFRLTALGRHVLQGTPAPVQTVAYPQTLLVQPNADILAYRQGLTPALIARLSQFAHWKQIGPACTLELTAEETYRGLEAGLTLADITQVLERHGMRPIPPSVADLLRRWADKRERITVFSSATLVEFSTPAELDTAIARGIISIRLTDRIGLTPDGSEPEFRQLRLIGNRDYEARPQQCVTVADDGITLMVDAAQSDLLLEAEIGKLADPVAGEATVRTYRLTPETLQRAFASGMTLDDLDRWFLERTGDRLTPAGRLFVIGPQLTRPVAAQKLVIQLSTPDITDGILQWPESQRYVQIRLGPTAIVIRPEDLEPFRSVLAQLNITLDVEAPEDSQPEN